MSLTRLFGYVILAALIGSDTGTLGGEFTCEDVLQAVLDKTGTCGTGIIGIVTRSVTLVHETLDYIKRRDLDNNFFSFLTFESVAVLATHSSRTSEYKHKVSPFAHHAGHGITVVIDVEPTASLGLIAKSIANVKGGWRHGTFLFLGAEKVIATLYMFDEIKRLEHKIGVIKESCAVLWELPGDTYSVYQSVPIRGHAKLDKVRNRLIRIAGSKMPPYCDVRTDKFGKKVFSGSNFEIIDAAATKYNFSYTLDAPPKKSPGARLPNGTWIGMLADVLEGKADMTIVNAYNVQRYKIIDFTRYFSVTTMVFVTRYPQTSVSLTAIIRPYDTCAWIMIILAFFAVILAYAFLIFLNPFHRPVSAWAGLSDAVFIPLATSLRQDLSAPRGLRNISMWWAVFVLLIGVGYESNLVSYLTFPEAEVIPTNFFELADYKKYKLHFHIFSNIGRSLFLKGTSDMLLKLTGRYNEVSNPIDCVLPAFKEKSSACIGWNDILNSAMGRNLTLNIGVEPLFMAQHSLLNNWLAFGLRKDSEFTEAFSYIGASYCETGLVQRWKEEFVEKQKKVGKAWMMTQNGTKVYEELSFLASHHEREPKPFSVQNVKISFLVFFSGMLLSIVAFVVEMLNSPSANQYERQVGRKVISGWNTVRGKLDNFGHLGKLEGSQNTNRAATRRGDVWDRGNYSGNNFRRVVGGTNSAMMFGFS